MFFHIDKIFKSDFSNHWQLGDFYVSTDAGWKITHRLGVRILYKGYADSASLCSLLEDIISQRDPKFTGNFCVMAYVDGTLQIQTDRCRSFPIYIGEHSINNLVPTDRTVWTDGLIIMDRDFDVIENKFDAIGQVDSSELDFQQAQNQVHDILTQKTQEFLTHNTLPLKVFLTGGVDSMLVYSYLIAAGAKFEMLDYFHFDHDYFWRSNSDKINQNWSYQQTHHWRDPCILVSGAAGDPFMLRNPVSADFYLRHLGTTINESVHPGHIQYNHIKLQEHQKCIEHQPPLLPSTQKLYHYLCNIMLNDWHHWHLGNTLHWNPLRDLDIAKIIMRLPLKHAINQIVNCEFSIGLIERNIPNGASLVSAKKDSGPTFKNLNRLFDH